MPEGESKQNWKAKYNGLAEEIGYSAYPGIKSEVIDKTQVFDESSLIYALKNKKQDKQSEKPVPRKKEEEQTEGTGRNSAQNPCYGLLVCTGISYIYCLDFKNKNPGSYFNTSVSLADHY